MSNMKNGDRRSPLPERTVERIEEIGKRIGASSPKEVVERSMRVFDQVRSGKDDEPQ